ncbi:MAG TPA: hypothetical protein DEA08_23200, partial [Planctomycetes bacterium]|nr:hypothetical protein [Planctomycetota bacterium]
MNLPARVGRYEVLEELGRGGMGRVLRARDPELGREVALKLLLAKAEPDLALRFQREAELLARLDHPHVVRAHEAGRDPAGPYLAMELVRGESLQARLNRSGPLPLEDALRWTCELASALEAAHQVGVLHRDLKPANVLIDEAGRARLTDFGLARDAEGQRLTHTGEVLGTPAYMAPEQCGDPGSLDSRCDVYGLAATLYALLAGAPPFSGSSTLRLLELVLTTPPSSLRKRRSEVPAWLDAVILGALAKDPSQRPPSASAFAEALRSGPPARRLGGRRLLGAGIACALLVGAGVATSAALTRGPAAPIPARALRQPTLAPTSAAEGPRRLPAAERRRLGLAPPPAFDPKLDQPNHLAFAYPRQRSQVSTSPSKRGEHIMVWVPELGSVLHGGWNDGESQEPGDDRVLADTWLWNGFEWQRMPQEELPPARYAHAGAYDLVRRQLVIHGGYDRKTLHGDTWLLERRRWRRHEGSGPSARMHHAMAYDPDAGRVVLFGGAGSKGQLSGETWAFAEGWRRLEIPGPPARRGAAMAYDPYAGGLLLCGGDGEQGLLSDLWLLSG